MFSFQFLCETRHYNGNSSTTASKRPRVARQASSLMATSARWTLLHAAQLLSYKRAGASQPEIVARAGSGEEKHIFIMSLVLLLLLLWLNNIITSEQALCSDNTYHTYVLYDVKHRSRVLRTILISGTECMNDSYSLNHLVHTIIYLFEFPVINARAALRESCHFLLSLCDSLVIAVDVCELLSHFCVFVALNASHPIAFTNNTIVDIFFFNSIWIDFHS